MRCMEIYPKIYSQIIYWTRVILAPKNDSTLISTDILNHIPGEQRTYHSYDKIICDNDNDINNYPVEFFNFLTISGLLPDPDILLHQQPKRYYTKPNFE